MNPPRTCYLRKTEIKLLDGQVYSFRALPLSSSTIGIVEAIMDDATPDIAKLKALVQAVERSLSYDQDAETVARILDDCLIPMTAKGKDGATHKKVMAALAAGLG